MNTLYHAKLFAHQILSQGGQDTAQRISRALNDACVDLNPHQINAALFALKNPLSNGVILAEEVGLGKTIEAGLVLSQSWAEGKRSILIIAPKSLRHQWQDELDRLFGLPSIVLNSQVYRRARKAGEDPFSAKEKIIISNEHFVDSNAIDIKKVNWDLVIIDEAHKLRNVWRKGTSDAKRAKAIRDAVAPYKKLLLTATPMQNNLMELFGLVTFIDDHILGTPESFQNTFCNVPEELRADRLLELRQRLSRFFTRELRRNVKEYIDYTNRNSVTFTYTPTDDEEKLRVGFEEFLRRPVVVSIPASSMSLLKLIYLKLLASSTFAIKNSLLNLYKRLVLTAVGMKDKAIYDKLISDIHARLSLPDGRRSDELERFEAKLFYGVMPRTFEGLLAAYTAEHQKNIELTDEESEINEVYSESGNIQDDIKEAEKEDSAPPTTQQLFTKEMIQEEAETVLHFIELSRNISDNKKADALIEALKLQFTKAKSEGWPEKAVIFTEFRSTQNYILKALKRFGLDLDKDVVIFNGDSGDVEERKNLVQSFRDNKKIFLTTEAGSEGLNLQCCNLILNYDLPWNPQRIEQRIGRCHRYGQKLDVIVVNFVNTKNSADVRVLELLQDKFNLFKGAFGASDEILGAIESGQDFEQEILKIYLNCRTETDIKKAFEDLQNRLRPEIDERLQLTKKTVLETFDEDVQAKLKLTLSEARSTLDEFEQRFKSVVSVTLGAKAKWLDDGVTFELAVPMNEYPVGPYSLNTRHETAIPLRTGFGLGEYLLKLSANIPADPSMLVFELKSRATPVAHVQNLDGKSGLLIVGKLKSQSFGMEERIVFAGDTDDGTLLDSEIIEKMFRFAAKIATVPGTLDRSRLDNPIQELLSKHKLDIQAKNQTVFEAEVERLDNWAEDIKLSLELEIRAMDREIRQLKIDSKKVQLLAEKVESQKKIKALESRRNEKRRELYDSQDKIEIEKDQLLDKVEANLDPKITFEELFAIQWKVQQEARC